ncbi:hypothetical protein [Nonomuraea roseoviolacea]|uniref:Uncharacterized protein n=1 Tax=Nonomuraea roseoviolacea subsp. carminata TaxID=160689 RepID=A0ABT1JUW9_9ACTN|nr:hypothetical protein [Nonomuraea roseoviolacea]MCP2345142.1 hypothetical protein [Nonomuraea roseoviolacea subsp. carminata]
MYRDDRQVKYLYVDLDQAWNRDRVPAELPTPSGLHDSWANITRRSGHSDEQAPLPPTGRPGANGSHLDGERAGWIRILARPGRDVVADLTMANRLRHLDDSQDESNPFEAPDLPDDLDDDWNNRLHQPDDSDMWDYVERFSRFYWLTRFQRAVLGQIDSALFAGLCMYLDSRSQIASLYAPEPYRSHIASLLRDTGTMSRGQLLAHPLTLKLPGLPRNSREGEDFKAVLRERMEDFKVRRPMFNLLTVPVKMTFLVVPPEQGKDLDNIVLTALPIAHEVLRPHIEPHLLAPQPPGGTPEPWRVEALRRLRSLNANSVAAYQVIELARTPQDPPAGVLRLALGPVSHSSWWDQAADYVDKRIAAKDELSG